MSQMALPLRLADHAVFASFLATGNETLVAMLRELADSSECDNGSGCWIWGAAATGKTHLLQAVCDEAGDQSVYVPLSLFRAADPAILEGLASRPLVCIDDIDSVAATAPGNMRYSSCITRFSRRAAELSLRQTSPHESASSNCPTSKAA